MAKVSKNIKQLRSERGMTQDELAARLHVTRQAISSWENDRTQPDIYMLGKMREIFGITIEELLYGKKRNTNLELEKPDYTGTLITVISVLGGLLVAVGIILVFAFLWDDMPDVIKYALTQLPLVAGCCLFCYVYSKKRDKKPWCEGGAVVTLVGVYTGLIVSYEFLGLYKAISGIIFYFGLCALAAGVMFALKSVVALPVFYITFMFWCTSCTEGLIFEDFGMAKFLAMFVLSFISVVAGEYFCSLLKKREKETHRITLVKWITAIYLPVLTGVMLSMASYNNGSVLFWISALCLIYYIFSFKEKSIASPFKFIGFFGMCIIAFLCGQIGFDFGFDLGYELAVLCFIEALFLVAAVCCRPDVLKSKIHLALGVNYLLIHIGACVSAALLEKAHRIDMIDLSGIDDNVVQTLTQTADKIGYVIKILCLVFFAIMIFAGAKQKKLLEINIGFIGIVAQVISFIFFIDIHIIYSGIVLIVCGGTLLAINLKLVKDRKQKISCEEINYKS